MAYLVQASLPYYTNLPRDVVTNTFHFIWQSAGEPGDADYGNLTSTVANFYETLWPAAGNIECANWVVPANFRVRIYNLAETPPRVPVWDVVTPLTVDQSTSANFIPPEASIVLSYHGLITSGTNPARKRGRIYIGALGLNTLASGSGSSFPTIATGFRDNIIAAAEALASEPQDFNWRWGVWSPTAQLFSPTVGGWVDNAIDTQRRRGNTATSRELWTQPT